MHPGRGPGLTSRRLGQRGGTETVTLTESQMPSHRHSLVVEVDEPGEDNDPNNQSRPARAGIYAAANNLAATSADSLSDTGGTQAHNNMQPFLTLNYIIALTGLFPSRS